MKIKTTKINYDELLKLEPIKLKEPKKNNIFFRTLLYLVSFPELLFMKKNEGYRVIKVENYEGDVNLQRSTKEKNIFKLTKFAELFRIQKILDSYLEVLL